MPMGTIVEVMVIGLMALTAYKGYMMYTGKTPGNSQDATLGIVGTLILGLTNMLLAIDPKIKDRLGIKDDTK